MNISGLAKLSQSFGSVIVKNSPSILTAASVAGLLTTVFLAVKATPKALQLIDDELYYREDESEDGEIDPITKMEAIRLTWRCYIPAVIMGGVTIACIIGANSIHLRRNAALASLYSLTDTAFKEYKEKVRETIGEQKARKVREDITEDQIKANPPTDNNVIYTGNGETLCYDTYSGRYFKSDIEQIRRAVNRMNLEMLKTDTACLNDLYYELGLGEIKLGQEIGWSVRDGLVELRFSSHLTPNDVPCLAIDYDMDPLFDIGHRR